MDPERPRTRARRAAATAVASAGLGYAALCALALAVHGPGAASLAGIELSLSSMRAPMRVACAALVAGLALGWPWAAPAIERRTARARALLARRPGATGAAIFALAALALTTLKLAQYRALRTGAYDHGAFANILWNAWSGHGLVSSIQSRAYLGDHFAPLLYAVSGVYGLWPDAGALLVVQSVALAAGAWGLFHFARRELDDALLAAAVAVAFLANPYLHRVSRFDFHGIALTIPMFLWMGVAIRARRRGAVAALAIVAALTKETAFLVLIGAGGMLALRRDTRQTGAVLGVAASLGLLTVVLVLIPHFRGEAYQYVERYASSPAALLAHLVAPERLGSLAALLGSFGFLSLAAPAWTLPSLLPVAVNLSSEHAPQWRFADHYSATALPFLALAAVVGLARLLRIAEARFDRDHARGAAAAAVALLALWNASTFPRYLPERSTPGRGAALRALAGEIPDDASVCAQTQLVPRLALRQRIDLLVPDAAAIRCGAASFVVLDPEGSRWPFADDAAYERTVADLVESGRFDVERRGPLVLLRATRGRAPARSGGRARRRRRAAPSAGASSRGGRRTPR